jgi:hypothetical protein
VLVGYTHGVEERLDLVPPVIEEALEFREAGATSWCCMTNSCSRLAWSGM